MKNLIILFFLSIIAIDVAHADPTIQSLEITPSLNGIIYLPESSPTNIQFEFNISRPMSGTSFEEENLKICLIYQSPQGEITKISSEYHLTSKDFLSGGGSILSKVYPAVIPANSFGGKVYLRVFNYTPNGFYGELHSAEFPTKNENVKDYKKARFVINQTSGAVYIQLNGPIKDSRSFYHIYSIDKFKNMFNETAALNIAVSLNEDPKPNTEMLSSKLYLGAYHENLCDCALEVTTYLAKDSHSGSNKVYLVKQNRWPNTSQYICRRISSKAFDAYCFDYENIRTVDMNVQDGTLHPNSKYINYPYLDIIE